MMMMTKHTCFAMMAVWPCRVAVLKSAIASVFLFVLVFTTRSPIVASNLSTPPHQGFLDAPF